jgi:ribosomal protein S12 methylthiotransferase accessory factor
MEFKSSPKIYKNYKSDYPENTVSNIKKYLKENNLKLKYKERKIIYNKKYFYFGSLIYRDNNINVLVCSGKGTSKKLCEASAYSELIERILSKNSLISHLIKIKIKKLKKYEKNKIDINDFFKKYPIKKIPKNRFDNWVKSFSIIDKKNIGIPYSFIENISKPNGLAAGNSLEEAISQAFCEICERYSLIEHLIKKIPAPTIDQRTIKNKKIINFIKYFNSINHNVEIKDFTLKNKVPVMGVLFTNNNVIKNKLLIKSVYYKTLNVGSHFNIEEAIIRCFTEKIQNHAGIVENMIEPGKLILKLNKNIYKINFLDQYFSEKENFKILKNFKKTKYHQPFLLSGRSLENFKFLERKNIKNIKISDLKSFVTKDFLEEVKQIKNIAINNKWKILVVDHSIKECPIKVVRVIIPSISDTLRFILKKIDNIDELIKDNPFIKKEKYTTKINDKFNYFKFNIIPENILIYYAGKNFIEHNYLIQKIIDLSKRTNNTKEINKIKKIIEPIKIKNFI